MNRIVLFVLSASVLLLGCPTANKCTSSTQCGAGQSCVNGMCMGGTGGGASSTGGGVTGTGGGSVNGGGSVTGGGATSGGSGGGSVSTGAESCSMAGAAQSGAMINGTTVGATDDVNIACTGYRNPGPDRVYAVTVPSMMRLVATATPEMAVADGGLQFDVAVYIVDGPAANCTPGDAGIRTNCLGGSDENDPAATENASFINNTASPKEVFVVVDSAYDMPSAMGGVTNAGAFSLRIDTSMLQMGDLCDSATAITSGTLTNQNLNGFLPDYGTSTSTRCVTGDGADRVYSISVPAGQRLTANATPVNDGGFDVFVNLVAGPASACAAIPLVCLNGSDSAGNGRGETVSYLNAGAAAQDLFVVVGNFDPLDTDTAFTLTTAVATPPAGDDCSMPTALTPGTPLTAQSFGTFGNDFGFGTSCGLPSAGPDRVYSVTVPQDKVVTITVTPDAMMDTSVSVIDGAMNCAPSLRCLASSPSSATGMPDVLSWSNRGTGPKTLLVLVDSSSTSSAGAFSINAVLSDPPAGDYCSNAIALPANTTVGGTMAGFNNDYTSSTTCTGSSGSDRVYSVSVPNGQRGKVTLIADAGFSPTFSIVAGMASDCEASPRVCVGGVNSATNLLPDGGFVPTPRVAGFFNGSGAAVNAFAIVDAFSQGEYSISFTSAAPPADDTCTTATTALPLTGLTGQTLRPTSVTFERDYSCAPGTGADRVYIAQAPANQRLQVTVTPTPTTMDAGFDPVLSIIDGPATACDSSTRRCLAGVDVGFRQAPETAGISNNSATPKTVYVVVGAYNDSPSVEPIFSLTATTTAVQAGDVCETAQSLTSGMTLPAETVMNFFHDYTLPTAGGCRSGPGADRVYSISVGAGQTLTVRGTPDMASDIVLNVIDGPASACNAAPVACLASADRGGSGAEDVATWMNATAAAKTVFVVVSNYRTGPMTYSLTATVQ